MLGEKGIMSDDHGSSTETGNEDEMYLYIVEYEEDAERKRAEYLFNNWKEGTVERPSGLVRVASDVDQDELYEELISKVPPEKVSMYRLDSVDADVSPETVTVEKEVNAEKDTVESFVEYMLSKKKAVLQSPAQNEYEVYTKKGRAKIKYQLSDQQGGTKVNVRISGYPPAPEFIAEFFENELAEYARSQE